jgi:predicted phosphodiesterase
MRLAIFADVHGNLPALELMIRDAGPVDGYVCLGDTVNYGPWSNECVDVVAALPGVTVLSGNHEDDFLRGRYGGTNVVARAFFDHCLPRFDRFERIRGLARTHALDDLVFSHTIEDRYVYADTPIVLRANHVIGHSHHQFEISQPPHVLVNCGSVGQNRAYINVVNYVVLTTAPRAFELRAVRYDERVVIDEMKARGYPSLCVDYYDGKPRF